MKPLLPWPTLSLSAVGLLPEDRDIQYLLAKDTYLCLKHGVPGSWRPAVMWRGYEGALLFWWGELARQRAAAGLESSEWVTAWGNAYRASEMAVGPLPWWLGDNAFHLRCQSHLIAGDVQYAGQFVHAPLEMAYVWPTEKVGEWQIA